MNKIAAFLCVCILLFSCKKNNDLAENPNAEKTIIDVAYGSSTQQKMDVYLPANRSTSSTYTVIMIHGGSWSGGDKSDFNTDIPNLRPLLGSDYAIFNINYRLANGSTVLIPQQLADINTAISFIASKAAEYNINTSKIGIMGASAGAHLTLLKAYTDNTNNSIKAVVNLFAPNDLTWMYNNHPFPTITQPVLVNAVGTTPLINASTYTSVSPINFVTATSPPTIIFHGTLDMVVPISESDRLKNKLQTMGVTHQYITYVGEQHGWTGANLIDTYNKAVNFIKLYVK